ncbi:MAG: bacteriohemerythrin [Desulfovibrio sp.]
MLEWSDTLSVQVEEINAQHKSLVDMVNTLHDAMTANKSKEVLSQIVSEMRAYSEVHFATEERYMDAYGYPDSESHKSEHRKFTAQVAQAEADYLAGKLSLSMDMLNFLSSWLVTHISDTDIKMGEYLRARGAS